MFVVQTTGKIYKEKDFNLFNMISFFGHKRRIEKLRVDVQDSFEHVKKDFNKVGEWIKHLDDKHVLHKNEITKIKEQLFDIQNDIIEIKDFISFFGSALSKDSSKHNQTSVIKQTNPTTVQTVVQTDVQTDILSNLSVMERGIVWALLNSDMKLSYEDIAALLGKNKSTIRGQINAIKQKNNGLIKESREFTGKKRLYISDDIKANIMKSMKVKLNQSKKGKK